MIDEKSRCWICQSSDTRLWKRRNLDRELRPEDLQITDSRYGVTLTLTQCNNCGFIFADRSEVDDLLSLYEQLVDPNYEDGIENRNLQMRWLIDVGVGHRPAAKTLLEIGSGIGLLIREARSRGLDAVGVEPSKSLVHAAARLTGTDIIQGTYPHAALSGRKFDLIYMVDVIEHVTDPVGLLKHCAESLASNGLLIVVTPDIGSIASRVLGRRWWHLRLAHVGYFDGRSSARAAAAANLKIVHTERALWFFPVRYIAERIAVYLPIGRLVIATASLPLLRRFYGKIFRLNLRDSTVFVMARQTP